jgi:hypothetical protein
MRAIAPQFIELQKITIQSSLFLKIFTGANVKEQTMQGHFDTNT